MEFPTVYTILADGFRVEGDDGAETSRADDGTLRVRRLWATDRVTITFRIGPLTAVQKQAVLQFYRSYRYQEIEWTDPTSSITYDVLMTREPVPVQMITGDTFVMEIYMEGVEQ